MSRRKDQEQVDARCSLIEQEKRGRESVARKGFDLGVLVDPDLT